MQDQEKSVFELWRLVISSAGLATRLGRILAATEDQKAIRETWLHPWQEKLLRRSGAGEFLVGFSRWMNVGAIAHIPIFPVTEELVYKYFCQLHRDGTPASRAAR